jgi:hypothetical protein
VTVIRQHIDALKRFRDQAEELAVSIAVTEEAAEISEMNRRQLDAGDRADGNQVKPPYTPKYAAYKRSLGLKTNVVTLRLTGDFYRSIKPEQTAPDEMELQSQDSKAPYLLARYGKQVLGLSEENIKKLAERIQPKMLRRLKAALRV